MSIYLISFQNSNGDFLENAVQAQKSWAQIDTHLYVIESSYDICDFRDIIERFNSSKHPARIIVVDISNCEWACAHLDRGTVDWLKKRT